MRKETPVRVIYTNSWQVCLVEWVCPKCEGVGWAPWDPWNGCKVCKGKGILDGIGKALYDESKILRSS